MSRPSGVCCHRGALSARKIVTSIGSRSKKEGSEFFIGTLNREEKKGKIIECFRSITGTAYSFTAESLSQDPGKNDASDQGYLESLYKTFGKEPVDIVDPL